MSESVARTCGITYRQLDFWVRRGWLQPANAQAGQGIPRQWPARELNIAREMGRLVTAGMTPEAAHDLARAGRAADVLAALAPPAGIEVSP